MTASPLRKLNDEAQARAAIAALSHSGQDLRAWDYDPQVGRWTNKDPSGFAGGLNLYAYVAGDPINYVDIDGRNPMAIGVGVGILVGVVADVIYQHSQPGYQSFDWMEAFGAGVAGGIIGASGGALLEMLGVGAVSTAACSTAAVTPEVAAGTSAVAGGVGAKYLQLGRFRMTHTVANHMTDIVTRGPSKGELVRPFLRSPLTVEEIMAAGKGVPDPGGVPGALRWDVAVMFRGAEGTWELVVKDDIIIHYDFVTR